jgi:hypothetical protein
LSGFGWLRKIQNGFGMPDFIKRTKDKCDLTARSFKIRPRLRNIIRKLVSMLAVHKRDLL